MSISINSIELLQTYLNGVMRRSEHHAGNVEGVSLALLGAVMWRATAEIEVREYKGSPANMLWFFVDENKYSLLYNHTTEQIELRERTKNGDLISTFDNSTSYQEVIGVFRNL